MNLSALIKGGVKAIGHPAPMSMRVSVMHKASRETLLRQLEPFGLDLLDGRVSRVNNMAWEFMQVDGMSFSDALYLAAEIVGSCDVAICEAAYVDVMALWQRLKGSVV